MRIGLFITCFDDLLFPQVGRAMVRILESLGHTVEYPDEQTCCGQLHFNTGYRDACVPLVRRFARAFAGYDVVVTPSASCAAMVRLHHPLLARDAGDPRLAQDVSEVAPAVIDLCEFLVDRSGVLDGQSRLAASFPHTVALHPTCHSTRLLRIGERPRRLLESVEGLRLIDLRDADQCCGFGGTFSIKNPDTSIAMGSDKVAAIEATGAEVVTATDSSCLIHLGGLLSRSRSKVRAVHLAEILATGLPA